MTHLCQLKPRTTHSNNILLVFCYILEHYEEWLIIGDVQMFHIAFESKQGNVVSRMSHEAAKEAGSSTHRDSTLSQGVSMTSRGCKAPVEVDWGIHKEHSSLHITGVAVSMLREVAEHHVLEVLEWAKYTRMHRKWVTLEVQDIHLVRFLYEEDIQLGVASTEASLEGAARCNELLKYWHVMGQECLLMVNHKHKIYSSWHGRMFRNVRQQVCFWLNSKSVIASWLSPVLYYFVK